MTAEQKIDDLVTRLNEANDYYRLGKYSGMTDREFDMRLKELYELEKNHPELMRDDSPTRRIGVEPLSGLTRVKHSEPMLSIANVYTYNELEKFLDQTNATYYTLEHKVDGVALALIYEDGRLVQALTRGDGIFGDDVTHNAKTIQGIPHVLPLSHPPKRLEIRGEVYMSKDAFQSWNALHNGKYANPRNATAGAIRLLESLECAKRPLRFIAHSVTGDIKDYDSQKQFWDFVQACGFKTANYHGVFDVASLKTFFKTQVNARINDLDYEVDGVVVKVNLFSERKNIGSNSVGPKWQIAYKTENYEGETVLQEVDWQVGKTGVLTPVARFAPVEIDGTMVSNATIHNLDIIRSLGLRLYDTVIVKKAGKIIPAIDSVVCHCDGEHEIVPPKTCPSCQMPVTVEREDGTVVRCTNTLCPAQVAGRILFYTGRTAVDMTGLGESVITSLVESGKIEDFADLYGLTVSDFQEVPRVGKTSAKKYFEMVQSRKHPPLDKFLIGLAIPGAGEGTAKRLTKFCQTLSFIEELGVSQLAQIPDIGKVTAQSIVDFFASAYWEAIKLKMNLYGVSPAEMPKAEKSEFMPLASQTIVVTGTLSHYKRNEIESVIERFGGKASGSVSKKTSFVLAGADAGSKLAKANELGIPVIDEDEFVRRIAKV